MKPKSAELCAEINEKETKVNNTIGQIVFKNTSVIKVVTASDTARGNRCNVLLLDEYRLLPQYIIDSILSKFLNYRRMPFYKELTEEERQIEYNKEKNLTMYLSSAYIKDHWAYRKCQDVFEAMVSGRRRQFVCGFPYQLAIKEGILDAESVAEQMISSDFNEVTWMMEMCAEWYGSGEDAFFDSSSISKNRKIKYPMLPERLASKLRYPEQVRITPKQNGTVRILSADIALMSSRKNKNDATAIFINELTLTKAKRYRSNIVYAETYEGMRTDDQALVIRRLFDEYQCDYLVIDANGLGLGVVDCLMQDISDPDTGEIYPAISCCNNQEMASRCTVPGAEKVIWAIKASAQFNSDTAFLLREGFRSGRIRLLSTELDADEALSDLKGFNTMTPQERMDYRMPYVQTTLLIDELIHLQHEESNGKVRIFEKAGMRKDRYSSLAYNYYVAIQLEKKMNKKNSAELKGVDPFIIKPPSHSGRAVNNNSGRYNKHGWY